jgi:chromosomal replication initiator protein
MPMPRAGILIDLTEPIVSTVNEHLVEAHLAEFPAQSIAPTIATPMDEGDGASLNTSDASSAMLHAAAQQIWRLCLETIRPQLTAQTMRTWFEPLEATALEGSEITLRAPSSFFCEWIGEHYQEILEQSLRDVLGPAARFRFDSASEIESVNSKLEAVPAIKSEESRANNDGYNTGQRLPTTVAMPSPTSPTRNSPFSTPTSPRSASPSMNGSSTMNGSSNGRPASFGLPVNGKRPAIESNLNPRYTFDTFIRGESNKLAYAAAMAVANNPGGTRYNPLVIYGSVGLGKTHLIQAIGHAAMLKFPSAKVLYTSSDRFTVDFVDSIQNDRINEFQALYRSIDVLIIDDVQFFAGKERTQDIFFHTFNALRELGKQIILTCDRPPKELKDLDDRLVNRLQWGLTTDIGAPDLETRIAILRHKAIADGIELPGEVIEFIAANVTSNIRELEGCLISLLAMSSLEGKEPTLDLAREVLRKVARRATPIISIEAIQRTVARRLGIEEELLRHKTRKQEVVLARQMAMYLCKEMTNHSLKSIGFHFGGRDHSTVIHAIQTIQEDMKLEPLLVKRIDELRKSIEMMQ